MLIDEAQSKHCGDGDKRPIRKLTVAAFGIIEKCVTGKRDAYFLFRRPEAFCTTQISDCFDCFFMQRSRASSMASRHCFQSRNGFLRFSGYFKDQAILTIISTGKQATVKKQMARLHDVVTAARAATNLN